MKTAIMPTHRTVFVAGATVALALAAMSFAGSARARDNVFWSVGVGAPGVSLNVGNAGVYMQAQPVYVQPAPVYYQPSPLYVSPEPVYYQPSPVYYQPQPVYYGRGWNRRHVGAYVQAPRAGYYSRDRAPVTQVYYQQGGRSDWRHDVRRVD